jgi:hypothetical protein
LGYRVNSGISRSSSFYAKDRLATIESVLQHITLTPELFDGINCKCFEIAGAGISPEVIDNRFDFVVTETTSHDRICQGASELFVLNPRWGLFKCFSGGSIDVDWMVVVHTAAVGVVNRPGLVWNGSPPAANIHEITELAFP